MTLEQKQTQMHRGTVVGLFALAVAFMAAAARSAGEHLEWFPHDGTGAGVLLLVWVVGLVIFGLAFGSLWVVGRRLEPQDREVLGDEMQVLMSRKNAVTALTVTFIVAVLTAVAPGAGELPGDAVAAAIVAVASATLAVAQLSSDTV